MDCSSALLFLGSYRLNYNFIPSSTAQVFQPSIEFDILTPQHLLSSPPSTLPQLRPYPNSAPPPLSLSLCDNCRRFGLGIVSSFLFFRIWSYTYQNWGYQVEILSYNLAVAIYVLWSQSWILFIGYILCSRGMTPYWWKNAWMDDDNDDGGEFMFQRRASSISGNELIWLRLLFDYNKPEGWKKKERKKRREQ